MRFVLLAMVAILAIALATAALRRSGSQLPRAERKALEAGNKDLRDWGMSAFLAIQELREIAWQHRDVAPEFATIMLDEIAKRERVLREKLPKGMM